MSKLRSYGWEPPTHVRVQVSVHVFGSTWSMHSVSQASAQSKGRPCETSTGAALAPPLTQRKPVSGPPSRAPWLEPRRSERSLSATFHAPPLRTPTGEAWPLGTSAPSHTHSATLPSRSNTPRGDAPVARDPTGAVPERPASSKTQPAPTA